MLASSLTPRSLNRLEYQLGERDPRSGTEMCKPALLCMQHWTAHLNNDSLTLLHHMVTMLCLHLQPQHLIHSWREFYSCFQLSLVGPGYEATSSYTCGQFFIY